MASINTPSQVHDKGEDGKKVFSAGRTGYVQDKAPENTLGMSAFSKQNVDSTRRKALENRDKSIVEHSQLIRETAGHEEDSKTFKRVKARYEEVVKLSSHVVNASYREILDTFTELTEDDPVLALHLHRIANNAGTDAIAKREQEIHEIKRQLTTINVERKIEQIKQLNEALRSSRDQNEFMAKLVRIQERDITDLKVQNISLQTELEIGPTTIEPAPEPVLSKEDEAARVAMQRLTGLEELPTSWADVQEFFDYLSENLDITVEDKKQEFTKKLTEAQEKTVAALEKTKKAQQKAKEARDENENLSRRHEEIVKANNKLRDDLADAKERAHQLELSILTSKADLLGRETSRKTEEQRTQELEKAVSELRSSLAFEKKQNQAHVDRYTNLESKNDHTAAENKTLSRELNDLKLSSAVQAAQGGGDVKVWTDKYHDELKRYQHCKQHSEDLQTDCIQKQKDLNACQEKLQAQTLRADEVRRELIDAQQMIDELGRVVETHDARFTDQEERTANIEDENQKLRHAVQSLRNQVLELKEILQNEQDTHQNRMEKWEEARANFINEAARVRLMHAGDVDKLGAEIRRQQLQCQKRVDACEAEAGAIRDAEAALRNRFYRLEKERHGLLMQKAAADKKLKDRSDRIMVLEQRSTEVGAGSAEMVLLRRDLETYQKRCKDESDVAADVRLRFESLQQIVLNYGFGLNITGLDLKIADELRIMQPIATDLLALRCKEWKELIRFDFSVPVERVTALELWVMSTIKPAEMDARTIYGFVQSSPTPAHLVFLKFAVQNVIDQVPQLTFEQSIFVLRGMELLWMTIPTTGVVQTLFLTCRGRLSTSVLVQGLYRWFESAIFGTDLGRGRAIFGFAQQDRLTLERGDQVITEEPYLIVNSVGTIFVTSKEALRIKSDDIAEYWNIWIEGYPNAKSPLKTKMKISGDNLKKLVSIFGQL